MHFVFPIFSYHVLQYAEFPLLYCLFSWIFLFCIIWVFSLFFLCHVFVYYEFLTMYCWFSSDFLVVYGLFPQMFMLFMVVSSDFLVAYGLFPQTFLLFMVCFLRCSYCLWFVSSDFLVLIYFESLILLKCFCVCGFSCFEQHTKQHMISKYNQFIISLLCTNLVKVSQYNKARLVYIIKTLFTFIS